MQKKELYYKLFFIFLIITSAMSTIYRSYVYSNSINDCALADIFPNVGAVITASFLFMGQAKYEEYKDELRVILVSVLGFILYEFIQIIFPISTFDWKDIVGTIIGGIITILIHKFLTTKFDLKNSDSESN
jgi:hypothetical protein